LQVQAIYNQGRIKFQKPLHLKYNNIRLIVTVPDEEIEDLTSPLQKNTIEVRVCAILQPYQHLLNSNTASDSLNYDAIRDEYLAESFLIAV
jgi:hypothetical protein